jgi:hypothetical protein
MYFYPKYYNKYTETNETDRSNSLFIWSTVHHQSISTELMFFINQVDKIIEKIWDKDQQGHCRIHLYVKV